MVKRRERERENVERTNDNDGRIQFLTEFSRSRLMKWKSQISFTIVLLLAESIIMVSACHIFIFLQSTGFFYLLENSCEYAAESVKLHLLSCDSFHINFLCYDGLTGAKCVLSVIGS